MASRGILGYRAPGRSTSRFSCRAQRWLFATIIFLRNRGVTIILRNAWTSARLSVTLLCRCDKNARTILQCAHTQCEHFCIQPGAHKLDQMRAGGSGSNGSSTGDHIMSCRLKCAFRTALCRAKVKTSAMVDVEPALRPLQNREITA